MTSGIDPAPPDTTWEADLLGPAFRRREIPLGEDPDGQGSISATLVRHQDAPDRPRAVLLHVHGLSDYFFHSHLAEFLAARDLATYGLDLRKCGRSRREGLTPHFVSDLSLYDTELDTALSVVVDEHPDTPVLISAHSTGGLVVPLWLGRRRDRGALDPVVGVVLDSPWFDLDVPAGVRPVVDLVVDALGRRAPYYRLPLPSSDHYGVSTHVDHRGDFDYDLQLKPVGGVGVRAGWLRAVRRAHRQLHVGLDLPLPVLLLRSTASSVGSPRPDPDTDLVLDVASMIRHARQVGPEVEDRPVPGARHDVFLSRPEVLDVVLKILEDWIDRTLTRIEDDPDPQETHP